MIGLVCRIGIIHMRFSFVVFGEVNSHGRSGKKS